MFSMECLLNQSWRRPPMSCIKVESPISLISKFLDVNVAFWTMVRITWANLTQKWMKVFSLAILCMVMHIEHIIREPCKLRNPCILHLMKLTRTCRNVLRQVQMMRFLLNNKLILDRRINKRKLVNCQKFN